MAVVADEQPPVLGGAAHPAPSASLTAPGGRPRGWELMRVVASRDHPTVPGTAGPGPAIPAASAPDSGATRRASRRRTSAPASSSSRSLKPPIRTPIVFTPARLADSQSHVRVADHHRLPAAGLLDRGGHEVGLGLGRLDVGRGGPAVDERARVEQLEVVVDLVGLGGGGQHDGVARPRAGRRSARARPRTARPRRSATCTAPSRRRARPRPARRRTPRETREATSWSPPIPMWRWMRQIGSTTPCWRNARYHAIACW